MPILDKWIYVGVEVQRNCSWDAHMNKQVGEDKTQTGETNVIPTDGHLDSRTKMHSDECDRARASICGRNIGREREAREGAGNGTGDSI